MPFVVPKDVELLVSNHLARGGYSSRDDVLRSAMEALAEVDEDLAAVHQALREWRAGDAGIPLNDAFLRVRTAAQRDAGE